MWESDQDGEPGKTPEAVMPGVEPGMEDKFLTGVGGPYWFRLNPEDTQL